MPQQRGLPIRLGRPKEQVMPDREPLAANPLREGTRLERTPAPCVMVIFGASGDLTKRKLIPALYNLSRERFIPGGFSVVGYSRRPIGDDLFRQNMLAGI